MTDDVAAGPNAAQIEFWNGQAGAKWVRFQRRMDSTLGALGELAMERSGIAAGERVIDVGCGCGDTTIEIARRVAPTGSVHGVDVSRVMLALAAERLEAETGLNATVEFGDGEVHRFAQGGADVVYSRFGVMFFANPVAAFANLLAALSPAGRLAFVCWRPLALNPWVRVPLSVAARHVVMPEPPGPEDPGEFAFADDARIRRILTEAGFVDIAIEAHDTELTVGGGGDTAETVDYYMQVGPMSRALADADAATVARVAAEVGEAIAPYRTEAGFRLPASVWTATARRP